MCSVAMGINMRGLFFHSWLSVYFPQGLLHSLAHSRYSICISWLDLNKS